MENCPKIVNYSLIYNQLNEIYPVSRETFQTLQYLVESLKTWQAKFNLVSSLTLDDVWTRHIADSLSCIAIAEGKKTWLDLGSGAGFPGLVVAIAGNLCCKNISLVEKNGKKCAFLRSVIRRVGVNANVYHMRIEDLNRKDHNFDIITARALAPLPVLLNLAYPWLKNGSKGLFYKGRSSKSEILSSQKKFDFDLLQHKSPIEKDSVILEISNLVRIKNNY